jgi:poly(A) polymerase/tRNA nucleotidyltransferase (CCA-adding enzyme)
MARVLPVIQARHDRAWLVGGWVRDRILGLETHDYDFVVPSGAIATARELANSLGEPLVVLDVERDTARVLVGLPPAVTYLDFAALRAPSVEADLLARDFTINAMAVLVSAWANPQAAVIDPAHGHRDLDLRLVRAVSADSFRQDPLRLLRAVRLGASLGFQLESQTTVWIQRDAELLDAVSRERVRDEFAQVLALPAAGETLRTLDRLTLLERIVPELAGVRSVAADGEGPNALTHAFQTVTAAHVIRGWVEAESKLPPDWPYEVFACCLGPYRIRLAGHLATILPGGRSVGVLLALAALLHDLGKAAAGPPVPSLENRMQGGREAMQGGREAVQGGREAVQGGREAVQGGREAVQRGREAVLGQPVLGALMAATVMRRLCFSGAETVRVRLTVQHHLRPGDLARETDGEPSRRAMYRFFRDAEPSAVDAILLSLADHLASSGPALDRERWSRHLALGAALLRAAYERREEVVEPPPVIDGHDLMSSLGLEPGPEVGGLLDNIREAQAAGEVRTRKDALRLARRLLARGGPL